LPNNAKRPDLYATFDLVKFKSRVNQRGAKDNWAIVANISDHKRMIALAAIVRIEQDRQQQITLPRRRF
jgi:hypothetical protein